MLLGRARLAHHRLLGRAGPGRVRHPLLAAALTVILAGLVFVGAGALLDTILQGGGGAAAGAGVLAAALAIAFFGLLVFDVNEAVSLLVLDNDLALLRQAPVRPGALLLLKLLDALPRTSTLLLVVALPALAAYAVAFPLPRWSWPLIAAEMAALWVLPLGLGVTLTLLLLRVAPPRRTREALSLAATLALTLLWVANAFLLPRAVDARTPFPHALSRALAPPGPHAWLPPAWVARSIARAAAGDARGALSAALPLVPATLAAALLAALAVTSLLHPVLARVATGGAGRHRRTPPLPARGALRALVRHDLRLFARDWTVLGDIVTAAALWTLLPLVGAPLHPLPAAQLARVMLLALTVGLGYEVAARAIPFERRALAWSRLAPQDTGRWLAGKLLSTGAISLPIVALAAAAMAQAIPLPAREWLAAAALVLPALGFSLALGVWTGAAFGDPQWTNPRAMLTLGGRLVASLVLLAQAGGWLAVSAAIRAGTLQLPYAQWWAPAVLALILSMVPIRAATARLARREWSY